jgi:hypothetical protein
MDESVPLGLVMFISAMVIVGVTVRAQWAAWAVTHPMPVSKLVITQRRRYGWTLVGQAAAAASLLWPLMQFGVDDTFEVLAAWRRSWLGWILGFCYWPGGILSPVSTLMAVISIHRYPAQAAKRVGGGYILTEHARQGITDRVVQPVVAPRRGC